MSNATIDRPVLIVIGPTAVGKTELSLKIAERYGGEIISVDSMQVYRYMDIGTAKPSIAERRGVPHHLLDVVTPDQHYDAACFARDALEAIEIIHAKKRLPILAGGTGLYLKALLQGLFVVPATDVDLRRQLHQRLADEGISALYQELRTLDPLSAQRIAASDRQRIIRALEIFHSSGRTWSQHLENQGFHVSRCRFSNIFQLGLQCDRHKLYARINKRCQLMVSSGLEEEVIGLLSRGYPRTLKTMGAIGYRHMLDYLEGRYNHSEMLELMSRDTRRYAKRQHTWFSRDDTVQWLSVDDHQAVYSAIDLWLKETPLSLD